MNAVGHIVAGQHDRYEDLIAFRPSVNLAGELRVLRQYFAAGLDFGALGKRKTAPKPASNATCACTSRLVIIGNLFFDRGRTRKFVRPNI